MASERIFITSFENVFAQQNMTNMTSPTQLVTGGGGMQQGGGQGMSGMGGMEHGGGQGMSGMGGMEHGGGQGMSGMGGMEHGGGQGMSGMGGMEHGGGQGMSGMGGMEHGGGQGMSGMGGMEHGGGQGMSGMGGMEHGGGQGMSGMGGMGDNTGNTPGMIKEMCHMGEDMPPHYCEPAYHVMSSVKGIRINDVFPVNDKELELEIQNMNRDANVTNHDIVIVGGGGGSLAGASVIQGGWNNSTQGYLKLDGSGSIYDLNSVHIHLFPLTE